MEIKAKDLFHQSSFDGVIFKYKVRNIFGILCLLFGLNRRIEIPLNIILKYRTKNYWFGISTVEFVIEKSAHGSTKLSAFKIKRILFLSSKKKIITPLQVVIDENIQVSQQGLNIGLSNLNVEDIRAFYDKSNQGLETQSQRQVTNRFPVTSAESVN